MNILDLLIAFQTSVTALQTQLADAQAAVDQVAKDSYDRGFAAGVASVPVSVNIYSQADLDAMVGPLREKIAEMQAQLDSVPAQISDAVAQALMNFKAVVKLAYEDAQAQEAGSEAAFGDLLK